MDFSVTRARSGKVGGTAHPAESGGLHPEGSFLQPVMAAELSKRGPGPFKSASYPLSFHKFH